jgi:hypothetical protein
VAIALSGRVSGRASRPSRSRVDDGGESQCVFRKVIGYLDFSRREVFIGEGASSGVDRGDLTCRGRDQGPGPDALLCGAVMAPFYLLFGSLEASVKFWASGFDFVQFREYFLCNFSET